MPGRKAKNKPSYILLKGIEIEKKKCERWNFLLVLSSNRMNEDFNNKNLLLFARLKEESLLIEFINTFNWCIFVVFLLFYAYQLFYIVAALVKQKRRLPPAKKLHKFAYVIAARNESSVIAGLINSIKNQDYPSDLIDVFVVADNCTDNTAEIARNAGAIVYERNDMGHVGKGYALDFVFDKINTEHADKNIEAFLIFDADNLVDKNYMAEINRVYDSGFEACTSYRNSKNYDSNWISAGYSLWFLRESKFLNNPRMILNTNCAVSGTGFMISKKLIDENGGWKYTLLTEDIEFSVDSAIKGVKIGCAVDAVFYDEQPVTFKQSWRQRMRWAKGFYQVFGNYGKNLVKGIFTKGGSFACYDMMMTIMPALFISLLCVLVNASLLIFGMVSGDVDLVTVTLTSLFITVINFYATLYVIGIVTTISEWDEIKCSASSKILYTFTFPIFMFTYVPIALAALFKKVEWQPIKHGITKEIHEFEHAGAEKVKK